MIADSSALVGAKPAARICAALAASPQLSLVATMVWSDERTSVSVGLPIAFGMPAATSEGPAAVTTTVLLVEPLMMKPPIITSLPRPTLPRVEMFESFAVPVVGAGAEAEPLTVCVMGPAVPALYVGSPE